ncbi:hypothetical protein QCA50_020530 [Cerrena zonata]|uniref:Uncharacterized protein n=1 Tax=Cerrena zonata TaxID=2478898 RepID=A0AAW0FH20_9APHY
MSQLHSFVSSPDALQSPPGPGNDSSPGLSVSGTQVECPSRRDSLQAAATLQARSRPERHYIYAFPFLQNLPHIHNSIGTLYGFYRMLTMVIFWFLSPAPVYICSLEANEGRPPPCCRCANIGSIHYIGRMAWLPHNKGVGVITGIARFEFNNIIFKVSGPSVIGDGLLRVPNHYSHLSGLQWIHWQLFHWFAPRGPDVLALHHEPGKVAYSRINFGMLTRLRVWPGFRISLPSCATTQWLDAEIAPILERTNAAPSPLPYLRTVTPSPSPYMRALTPALSTMMRISIEDEEEQG